MKNKTVWNKPENEFIAETMENGRKCYYGQYTDKAVPFAFRLAEQPTGSRYRCRGTVWAVPPDARGKIFDMKKNRNVVTEVSLNTTNENAIKDRILHSVWNLWGSHAEAIYRAMYGAFARAAADITPQIAAQLYAERYEDSLHRLGQTPKEHRKAAKIRAYFEELPLKPMAQFTERDLQPVLKKLKDAPKADQKLLRGFWNYCLERRYCQGANPFPEQQSKRSDPKRKSNAVFTPEHLSEGEIAHVFQTLLNQAAKTPMACAAALQLGGGFSIAQIQQLRWRDVLFEPDMVRIRTRDDVCGGIGRAPSCRTRRRCCAAGMRRCAKKRPRGSWRIAFFWKRTRMVRFLHPASWFDITIVSLRRLAFGQRQLQRRARKPTPVVCCWRLTRIR